MTNKNTKNALRDALKAVADLQTDGYIHAPIKPTQKMIEAGNKIANISDELAEKIYITMLAAID